MPFNHVSIPVGRHYTKMRDFYRTILQPLGYSIYLEGASSATSRPWCGFQTAAGQDFWLGLGESAKSLETIREYDGNMERTAAPIHIAFSGESRKQVDEWYENAIKAGAVDNGKPGEREYAKGYYAAFVIDPLGNNIELLYFPRP
ncbi:hypothetical protein DL768_001465 [Monosporascus sp. mg162]|nr:hypothetical protein DL768_001465 [Monosporascus sp. mg162]